jgi:3-hydroxyisobutyrate dehydrogenase-like beta-hydroxyacid dehydrogenase
MSKRTTQGKTVGLIGLGNMGRGLGRNLIDKGFSPAVCDKDAERVAELVSWGATDGGDVAGVARRGGVVITCLPSLAAVRAVYTGAAGLIENAPMDALLVDCSTCDPMLSRELGAQAAARGIAMVDAPLLRQPKHAWEGRLLIVAGGAAEDVARARPVLEAFAEEVVAVGALGNGQAVKVINNSVSLGTHALICEAFTVARCFGIDLDVMYRVMNAGMAAGRKLDDLAPRIIEDNHAMSFAVDLCLKDTTLFTELAGAVRAPALVGDAVRNAYLLASLMGHGADNQSRLATALRTLASGPADGEGGR